MTAYASIVHLLLKQTRVEVRRRGRCGNRDRRVSTLLHPFFHLDDFIGDQTMRFAMDFHRGLLAGSADKAEDLARSLIEPVLQVLHPVFLLDLEVLLVGAGDRHKSSRYAAKSRKPRPFGKKEVLHSGQMPCVTSASECLWM